jgi:hypothetical protein
MMLLMAENQVMLIDNNSKVQILLVTSQITACQHQQIDKRLPMQNTFAWRCLCLVIIACIPDATHNIFRLCSLPTQPQG